MFSIPTSSSPICPPSCQAGKRLLLITNSDFHYSDRMMSHAFDRFLPEGMTWRSLFDMVRYSSA